ncbi:MAG: glycoside hydrolase 43 family protein [Lachnospiraceae bacterium]|nr:glycoside hydrolase 43 family protein [Lachnospiraceae bacterium]
MNETALINPVTRMDYPDPDVIRVGDIYYMVSTTMYFMPGCEILRSYDLIHWEHAAYVYDLLDSTPAQRLEDEQNIYGRGMWAASLRYHDGIFYVCFVANDTHKTYLYRSRDIRGPWTKSEIRGFYHDNSILFDDDGRIFIVYGNREIRLTELDSDLSGPKKGGIDRVILKDRDDAHLGFEGSHFYKIDGRYYLFMIHIPKAAGRRTQCCYTADDINGEFSGGDVLNDDMGYHNMGVAQGGIVDTPDGRWYSMLFQDSGAVGRIPVLVPVSFREGVKSDGGNESTTGAVTMDAPFPVFGHDGKVPEIFDVPDNRPGYEYIPLVGSDDFKSGGAKEGDADSFGFLSRWQFNHEPDLLLVEYDKERGRVTLKTDRLAVNLVQAVNTLTQRMVYPGCSARVTIDASDLREGDYAGLCLLESEYAFIGVTRRDSGLNLVMAKHVLKTDSIWGERNDGDPAEEIETIPCSGDSVTLCARVKFEDMKDEGRFGFYEDGAERPFGEKVKLRFRLDHFTGVRFGLFIFSTKEAGGSAAFSDFVYVPAR